VLLLLPTEPHKTCFQPPSLSLLFLLDFIYFCGLSHSGDDNCALLLLTQLQAYAQVSHFSATTLCHLMIFDSELTIQLITLSYNLNVVQASFLNMSSI